MLSYYVNIFIGRLEQHSIITTAKRILTIGNIYIKFYLLIILSNLVILYGLLLLTIQSAVLSSRYSSTILINLLLHIKVHIYTYIIKICKFQVIAYQTNVSNTSYLCSVVIPVSTWLDCMTFFQKDFFNNVYL